MLYKLVLVTYPLDLSERINSPSNFRLIQKINCVPQVTLLIVYLD